MDWIQTFVLAAVQGLTEFLPISSSAHLVFVPQLLGWPDQGLVFDVAVHVGTLLAVIGYFRADLWRMARAFVTNTPGADRRLAWQIGVATIPVGLAGLLLHDWIALFLRSPLVIAVSTLLFGLLLGAAHWYGAKRRTLEALNWQDVLWIGCAQALALIPGTSRAGITLTAACFRGLTQQAAARFSFLLSIPVISLAGAHALWSLKAVPSVPWGPLFAGTFTAFITAYACIGLFLRWIERIGLLPFVGYRVLLSVVLLLTFW